MEECYSRTDILQNKTFVNIMNQKLSERYIYNMMHKEEIEHEKTYKIIIKDLEDAIDNYQYWIEYIGVLHPKIEEKLRNEGFDISTRKEEYIGKNRKLRTRIVTTISLNI